MKTKSMLIAALLVCSITFLISFQALRTYAGIMEASVYSDDTGMPPGTPMFSGPEASNLVPGDSLNGVLHVFNNRDEKARIISLSAQPSSGSSSDNNLLDNLYLTIYKGSIPLIGEEIYQGSLADFISDGADFSKNPIRMGKHSNLDLDYQVDFINQAGNDCQNKSCAVDFLVLFESDEDTGQGPSDGGKRDPISTGDSDNTGPSDNEEPTQTITVDLPSPTMVPGTPNVVTQTPAEPAAEPIMEILENPTSVLPETGWAGIAGGGLAAILMVGGGLALKGLSRRRWK